MLTLHALAISGDDALYSVERDVQVLELHRPPIAVREGAPAVLAIAAACAAMMVRRNDLFAVIAGMAVAAVARAWLF